MYYVVSINNNGYGSCLILRGTFPKKMKKNEEKREKEKEKDGKFIRKREQHVQFSDLVLSLGSRTLDGSV